MALVPYNGMSECFHGKGYRDRQQNKNAENLSLKSLDALIPRLGAYNWSDRPKLYFPYIARDFDSHQTEPVPRL